MTDWQEIVEQHSALVWQTAYRLLGNHADAADCLQETFLSALGVARREPVRNWRGLLQHLATARALDRLRQRMAESARAERPPEWAAVASNNPGPVQQAQTAELADRLRRALAQLPERQAEAFSLRHLNDLSYREIARQLDVRTGAVGVLLHRARLQLRELLSGVNWPEQG